MLGEVRSTNNTSLRQLYFRCHRAPSLLVCPGDLANNACERRDDAPRLTTTNVSEPPVRQAGEKVEDGDALVTKLKALGIA